MIRISAEFENPDIAELALKRVKESVTDIYSANIFYNKTSDYAQRLRRGSIYTVIPTAVTAQVYLTAVMESPASEDIIEEPLRSRKTNAYLICDDSQSEKIRSILGAMGALNVRVG